MVNTAFWDDSYIINLDPVEKLLFLYLLTNTLTNISGIYEITNRRIGFDTGIDKDMVEKILERFIKDGKIKREGNWIVVINFIEHQSLNPKVIIGIEREIKHLPENIKKIIDYHRLSHLTKLNLTKPNVNIPFEKFWNLYDKKRGDKTKLETKWNKLTDKDRTAIMDYIPKYKLSQPDKQYRKDPQTFLNNKSWNDELLNVKPEINEVWK